MSKNDDHKSRKQERIMNTIPKTFTLAATVFLAALTLAVVPQATPAFAQTASQPAAAALPESTIRALQEALNKQGIAVTVDGVINEPTRAAVRKYQSQHHLPVTGEPDSATLAKLGVAGQKTEAPGDTPPAAAAAGGTMGGSGMGMMGGGMGPQMMQSMPQGMGPGMMGGMGGPTAPQAGMGPGMMGSGQMPMAGGSMPMQGNMPMQGGMTMCPMMAGMMGMQSGTMPGRGAMGPQSMMGQGNGPGMIYGMPSTELSADQVKTMLQQALGNPRLEIGKVTQTDESTIVAEIVTKDGSVVQKLAFNRYPGLVRQLP
jgi:hypothetical protein